MKKFVAVALILLLSAGLAFAKSYEVTRKAGDYTVDIKMDKNPPVVGPNNIEIVVRDAAGKAVSDAKVLVDYGMPAMPGHPAMGYKTDAQLQRRRLPGGAQHLHEGTLDDHGSHQPPGESGIGPVHRGRVRGATKRPYR